MEIGDTVKCINNDGKPQLKIGIEYKILNRYLDRVSGILFIEIQIKLNDSAMFRSERFINLNPVGIT